MIDNTDGLTYTLHTFVIIKHNYSKVSTMQKLVLHVTRYIAKTLNL